MPVFDIEADGLSPTKIYVLSYWGQDGPVSLTEYEDMRKWLLKQPVLIGHNIISYDIPHLERLLDIKIKAKLIDTLYLSWYLWPERVRHGLEWWGEDFGIPKPKVQDWFNLPLETYIERCEEDVKINQRLWEDCISYLAKLYGEKDVEGLPIIAYLMFKADCAREQEYNKIKLDLEWCQGAYDRLLAKQEPMLETLKSFMPMVKKFIMKNPPTKPFKKDGTMSVEGAKWNILCKEVGKPQGYKLPIKAPLKEEEPNPNSPEQVKNWLFELGWEPETFKFIKEDDGSERKIPQVKIPNSSDLCPSVLALSEEQPAVRSLVELSILKHRLGLLKGFLENHEDGFLKARVQGLTNTLRFKHTEIVNLPGVAKPYGEEIRGCLVAREGYELVGTDMVSLEDTTKRHYMYFHDPEYVDEMSKPGFDPHLSIAVFNKAITKEEYEFYSWYLEKNS